MTLSRFVRTNGPRRPKPSLEKMESSTPFPKKQMLVLAICRICEPIAFMGIFPYIYFMVEDFHFTNDKSKISFYAGMVTSAFTFAEFSTGLLWGRLSDKIGRKPVLLMGLVGTALSVLTFGFAQNLYVALAARAMGGLLNGNMGVLQSTVAELVTSKEHQPRAYTIMPLVWCLGSIVGPMIGGALARPCISYPDMFPRGSIWDKYPYLLPNVFSALVVVVGVVNGVLFLEETHAEKKKCRDRGRELGDWILLKIFGVRGQYDYSTGNHVEPSESEPLLSATEQETESVAETVEPIPKSNMSLPDSQLRDSVSAKPIFTRNVILNVIAFGILAFHTMTFDQLFPVFLSTETPKPARPQVLPFKFVHGFGLDTKTVGMILSAQGIYSLFVNMALVPTAIRKFGALRLFQFLAVAYFSLYLVTPYLALLPDRFRMMGIAITLVWKCTFSNMAYPSNAILTANSAPNKNALGTINGVAASTASLCRGFGPMVSGILYSLGLQSGYSGLAWWCTSLVAIVGAVVALSINEPDVLLEKSERDVESARSHSQDRPLN